MLEAVAGSAPLVELPTEQVLGQALTDVMVAIKLQESKSAGRRLIKVRRLHLEQSLRLNLSISMLMFRDIMSPCMRITLLVPIRVGSSWQTGAAVLGKRRSTCLQQT